MCNYKVLINSSEGYVTQCKTCSALKVAFASTLLTLSPKQFHDLVKTVLETSQRYKNDANQERKKVILPTAAAHVSIVLTPIEVCSFSELLNRAVVVLLYNNLFVFSNN